MELNVNTLNTQNELAYIQEFRKFFEKKYRKAAIFSHAYLDPDAVGSVLGAEWLLRKMGIESNGFYTGPVSHPQNRAVMNLLDPNLRSLDSKSYIAEDYDLHILVDTVPQNAGVGNLNVKFDIVVDHHKEIPDFSGLFINLKAGSCCATIYDIITKMGMSFSESDYDVKVATALLVGISTDTENMLSDDSSELDFKAWSGLFPFRNPTMLRDIVNFERPRAWIDAKASAILKADISESIGIVGMGLISGKNRDMIADMADDMVKWEGVDTAIVFALVDGERMEGSVRSGNASINVPSLCVSLGGKHGKGGGKLGKGAYRYDLAGGGIEEEDSDETKAETWEVLNKKETCRIKRVLKK